MNTLRNAVNIHYSKSLLKEGKQEENYGYREKGNGFFKKSDYGDYDKRKR